MEKITKNNIDYYFFSFHDNRFNYVRVFNKNTNELKWMIQDLYYSKKIIEAFLLDIPIELQNELEENYQPVLQNS